MTVAMPKTTGADDVDAAQDCQRRRSRWGRNGDAGGVIVLGEGEAMKEQMLLPKGKQSGILPS